MGLLDKLQDSMVFPGLFILSHADGFPKSLNCTDSSNATLVAKTRRPSYVKHSTSTVNTSTARPTLLERSPNKPTRVRVKSGYQSLTEARKGWPDKSYRASMNMEEHCGIEDGASILSAQRATKHRQDIHLFLGCRHCRELGHFLLYSCKH